MTSPILSVVEQRGRALIAEGEGLVAFVRARTRFDAGDNLTTSEVAALVGCDLDTVNKHMAEAGICPMRQAVGRRPAVWANEDVARVYEHGHWRVQ